MTINHHINEYIANDGDPYSATTQVLKLALETALKEPTCNEMSQGEWAVLVQMAQALVFLDNGLIINTFEKGNS